MANKVRYVNAGSAGGDGTTQELSGANAAYASLAAALAAEDDDGDLVTQTNILEIICEGSTADTAVVLSAAGFTTSADYYIYIHPGASDWHAGAWDNSKYRLIISDASAACITNTAYNHLHIEGLQIKNTGTLSNSRVVYFPTGLGSGWQKVSRCLICHDHTGVEAIESALSMVDADQVYYIWNNIIYTATTSDHNAMNNVVVLVGGTAHIHNNTVRGATNTRGIYRSGGTMHLKNNLIDGASSACIYGTVTTEQYNATTDATGDGTGSRANQTFTYAGTDDYRITSADAGARNYGEDLSGDGNLAVTNDIAGTARPTGAGVVDIGAFEVAGAASSANAEVPIALFTSAMTG